ncbi:extracellular solute-binding protein [Saccharothrix texasensis]|uniref:Multiple sugar transport system substrate-binding protein n=1 Tax=Saccharothrix texasensis TaxID=103734 RepID=A0A3N1H5C6_9PSEU|nr:extracellular solute-binding protein [Saccharothrix texasensis]ROP37744.1 multiple sugar transport system substrate-binding protein [Saccharothrix texasensis]
MIRVLVPLLVLLTACTPLVEDDAADGTGPITFVDGPDTTANGQVRELVERWNAQADRREKVAFVEMPDTTDGHRAQLTARAQDLEDVRGGPDCYDVMAVDVVWTAPFAAAGHLVELDPDEFGADRMLPQAVETAKTPDGEHLWAVPWRSDAGLLFYREDVLDDAQVEPPTTWAELRWQASTIAGHYDLKGYVAQLGRYEGLTVNAAEAIWAHEGDLRHPDSPQAKEGVRALADGVAQGWIPREALEYNENTSLTEFMDGRALFMRNWPFAGPRLADRERSKVAGDWAAVPLPGPSALGGWNLAVSRCSAHQATARRFIQFATGVENQRRLAERAGFAPTIEFLYDEPGLVPPELRESVLGARARRPSPHYDALTSAMQESLHHVLEEPDSVDESMDQLAEDLTRAEQGR